MQLDPRFERFLDILRGIRDEIRKPPEPLPVARRRKPPADIRAAMRKARRRAGNVCADFLLFVAVFALIACLPLGAAVWYERNHARPVPEVVGPPSPRPFMARCPHCAYSVWILPPSVAGTPGAATVAK